MCPLRRAPGADSPRRKIIRRAVSGMLPKNRLRAKRLERLYIYPDAEHPYEQNLLRDHGAELAETFKKQVQAEGATVEGELAARV